MLFDIPALSGFVAGILAIVAFFLYIFTILWGNTKPNRATWWILTVEGIIILASYYTLGARDTIWIPASYVLGSLIVAILSLRHGEGGWTLLDKICLGGAGVSIVLWWLFADPFLALLTNIATDLFGLLPTIRKSYLHPRGENRAAWTLDSLASVINLFGVERWTLSLAVYPIYLVVFNSLIASILFLRRKKR